MRNLNIMGRFAAIVEATKLPWLLAGDFNMDPHAIAKTGILVRMGCQIVYDSDHGT